VDKLGRPGSTQPAACCLSLLSCSGLNHDQSGDTGGSAPLSRRSVTYIMEQAAKHWQVRQVICTHDLQGQILLWTCYIWDLVICIQQPQRQLALRDLSHVMLPALCWQC
jgi:hypothetical protein